MSLKYFAALLITTVNAEQIFAPENHRFLRAPDHQTTDTDSVPVNTVSQGDPVWTYAPEYIPVSVAPLSKPVSITDAPANATFVLSDTTTVTPTLIPVATATKTSTIPTQTTTTQPAFVLPADVNIVDPTKPIYTGDCWKRAYGRGIGKPIHTCPAG